MGWSKRQFIEQAFEEIGMAAYVFDITPDQIQSALRRLDSMMANWNASGIRIGWPMVSSPNNSELDTDTKVTDAANEAIYLNLGIRLAPGFGKVISTESKLTADAAYSSLLNLTSNQVPERQLPNTMPKGSGAKSWDSQFTKTPNDPLKSGSDSEITFE